MRGHWQEWRPGDPVLINRIVWGDAELEQMQEVLNNDWFGPGVKVAEFAQGLSNLTGIEHFQPVNSGSAALTLAVEAMITLGHWKPGDWILHPALTFPTSIVRAIKAGLVPLFVDVDIGTYQISVDRVAEAIKEYGDKIKGIILPHLLGNVCDVWQLLNALDGRPMIEDCCDTLGSYYGQQHVGSLGEVAAFSFYGSHHITTAGVGGALATNRGDIFAYAKSATHWGRTNYSTIEDPYERFVKRYCYDTLGSDCQMTEIQAAFGVAQLGRLAEANKLRATRFSQIERFFMRNWLDKYFCLPYTKCLDNSALSFFCYPITILPAAPFSRKEFATYLMENKIEIRPLFTGNITRHVAFARLPKGAFQIFGKLHTADLVGQNGLFLPAWGMSDGELDYMFSVLTSFFQRYKKRTM